VLPASTYIQLAVMQKHAQLPLLKCRSCNCLVAYYAFLQHLLATFRSSRVNSMAFELNPEQATLTVTLKCDNGALQFDRQWSSCKLCLLGQKIAGQPPASCAPARPASCKLCLLG
jgi:predicted Rdx family selenoprotein